MVYYGILWYIIVYYNILSILCSNGSGPTFPTAELHLLLLGLGLQIRRHAVGCQVFRSEERMGFLVQLLAPFSIITVITIILIISNTILLLLLSSLPIITLPAAG